MIIHHGPPLYVFSLAAESISGSRKAGGESLNRNNYTLIQIIRFLLIAQSANSTQKKELLIMAD